jgi:hypothetical protein
MNLPTIKIINGWPYLDGKKIKKKYTYSNGHCREIFYTDSYIVKIDMDRDYIDRQNSTEAKLWGELDERDRIFFCPVLSYKKEEYLIQQRLFFTSHGITQEIRDKINELANKYSLYDVGGNDDRGRNWAMVGKDCPIIFDYGSRDNDLVYFRPPL